MVVQWWSPRTLASVALAVLLFPMTTATLEIRDASEATVFVDGTADYFEFAPGQLGMVATWSLTGPDGSSMTFTRTGTVDGTQPTSFYLNGAPRAGNTNLWSASGDLSGTPANGTWRIHLHNPGGLTFFTVSGDYISIDDSSDPSLTPGPTLAVQSKAIHWAVIGFNPSSVSQAWNWHASPSYWQEPSTSGYSTGLDSFDEVDPIDEGPEEDPQFARFFASSVGPQSQTIPGASDSETIPGQDINTPPFTIPAACTVGPCTAETPLVTPAQPVPETCVPPVIPLLCVGPFTIPAQDLGDAPAICDAAEQVCVGPFPIPAQDVVETEDVTVAFDFTGLDVFADLHEAELTSIGPFVEVVPVPIIGDVPVTVCPQTCPFPVPPEGSTAGSITVTVTVGDQTEERTIPLDQGV